MVKKVEKKATQITKGKSVNPSTEMLLLSKKESWVDFVTNSTFMMFPEKENWRKRLILTMLVWAQENDSLELQDFCTAYKISRNTLYHWRDDHPDIAEAVNQVKLILGARRRKGALMRIYDKDMAMRDMHTYDPEWDEVNKYHAALKAQDSGPSGNVRIVTVALPAIENSPMVPVKKDKNE